MDRFSIKKVFHECPLCEKYQVFEFFAWKDKYRCTGCPDCRGTILFCPHCGRPLTSEAVSLMEEKMKVMLDA